MKKLIATAPLGWSNAEVFVDTDSLNGHFTSWNPDNPKQLPEICVGIKHREFWDSVHVLHHEVYEALYTLYSSRYQKTDQASNNSANYDFFFDHQVFAEVCACAGFFITKVMPSFEKAWKANKKPKKKKCIQKS